MKKKDLHHLVQPLRCQPFSLFVLLAGFVLTTLYSAPVAGLYVDGALAEPELLRHTAVNDGSDTYHLFSHGRPGQLLIDGQWLDAPALGAWLNDGRLDGKDQLNIYGCNFAKGETGHAAVAHLAATLGLPVAASDDLTGPDGDWQLEVTTPGLSTSDYQLPATNYPHNLQTICGVDIHIANDNSSSVNSEENRQSRAFVSQLGFAFEPYGTTNDRSRVSISSWGSSSDQVEHDFPLAGPNFTTSLSDILSYQSTPRVVFRGTDPYRALLQARTWVNQNPIAGRIAPKVIILMTDANCGQVNNNISGLATQIKNQGIFIVVMAIDNAGSCPKLQGTNVASPGGFFAAGDYQTLADDAINFVDNIRATVCANLTPPQFDLTVNLSNFEITNCNPGPAAASAGYTVTNNSSGEDFNGNLQISFYNGDPTLPGTQYLFTENAGTQTIALNGGTFSGTVSDPSLLNTATLYAVVNFDGGQAGNGVPLFYSQLPNQITVPDEGDVSNNISGAASRSDGTGCLPFANIDVQVSNSGVGCGDQVTYTVEVCNNGTAAAVMTTDDVAFYPPPGAVLLDSQLVGAPSTTFVDAPTSVTYTPGGSNIPPAVPRRVQVSASEDGNTFATNRRVYDFNQGSGSWVPRGALIPGGAQDISISADGNTVSVVDNATTLHVYDWNGSSWVQRGAAMLADPGATVTEESISGDGNTVVMVDNSNNEHKVFRWNGTAWQQLGSDFDGLGAHYPSDNFTYGRTALSTDGNTLMIAALASNTMYIFDWNGTNWIQRGAAITGGGGEFAINGDMTPNGNTVIVGRFFSDATIFDWDGSSWVQRSQPISNYAGGFAPGVSSVAISDDGNTVVLGIHEGPIDRFQVYTFINDLWVLVSIAPNSTISETAAVDLAGNGSRLFFAVSNTLSASGTRLEAYDINTSTIEISNPPPSVPTITASPGTFSFGTLPSGDGQAALSEDGNTYAISSRFGGGYARVYDFDGGTTSWVQRGADLPSSSDVSLSNDGNTLSVATNTQSLLVYDWNGSSWVQRGSNILADAGGMVWETALSADGNTVSLADSDDQECKIFRWDGTAWQQLGGDIAASVGGAFFDFRYGKMALSADGNTFGTTSAVYDWNGSSWVQRGNLPTSGSSMDLSADGNIIILGPSPTIFEWDGTNWTQRGTDLYPRAQNTNTSVAISDDGNTIVSVEFGEPMRVPVFIWVDLNWYYVGNGGSNPLGDAGAAIEIAGNGSRYMANMAEVSFSSLIARDLGGGSVSTLAAGDCFTYQRTYDVSGLAAGSYDYSVGVTASAQAGDDPVQYSPNTNFTANGTPGLNGFDGAQNGTDDLVYSGSSPACPVGDQVTVSVIMTGDGDCPTSFGTATVTINNQSGQTLSNALLNLNLSGTGATYSGEPYNKTNGLALAEPNIFDPAYPNVPNALSEKSGPQTLATFTLPAGTSTFDLDYLLGTTMMDLNVEVTQLPATVNATGAAAGAASITPGSVPQITGTCPAAVTAAATTLTLNYTATNAASVAWNSGSGGSFANPNAGSTTYTINDIDRANGYVDLSLRALSVDGCDSLVFCRVLINGITYDYGDAPASYDLNESLQPVAAAATIDPNLFLGQTVPDTEATTQPNADATGDGADEDGLMSTTLPVASPGQSNYAVDIQVTNNSGSDAYVYGFMDWNDDGDWNADPDERSALLTVPTGGLSTQTLLFNVPAGYTGGMRFLRLRLSSDDVAVGSFFGPAANGEVEDYEATALVCLDPPTADAGAATDNICSNEDYAAMATATNGSIAWTTNGDGTFTDATVEDAVYTPGSGDISSGSVTLTMTVTGTSPGCAGEIATDDVTLTIGAAPTADAGAAAGAVCADDAYTAAATATGGTILWTTSGDGTFANATVEDAVYTPGTADITAGTVTLTMTVTGTNLGCGATTASDMVLLTINPLPATPAITGDTDPLCLNETRILTTTASGTIVWSSSDVSVATVDPNTGEVTAVGVGNVDITYVVTNANGCSATSGAFPLTITDVGCAGQLEIRVMLQGALLGSPDALMRDDLRSGGYIPLSEPYSGSGNPRFAAHGSGGGETTTSGVLAANAGTPDAIVDWVLVELRDAAAPATILETRAALLQRDGDVVDPTDGVSPLVIDGTTGMSYYVSVKHRNHLGVMTATPRAFIVGATTTVDFITATAAEVFDVSGGVGYDGFERILISGQQALWAGNANADDQVKYQGPGNDAGNILFEVLFFPTNTGFVYNFNNAFGYFDGDINMDGQVKYQGPANDPSFVFFNLIFNYSGLNTSNLYNYDFLTEQLP